MKRYLSILIGLCLLGDVSAQQRLFKAYSYQNRQLYGIQITQPDDFKVFDFMDSSVDLYIGSVLWLYAIGLESEDGECLMYYPAFNYYGEHTASRQMFYDLKASLGKNPLDPTVKIDTARYARIIAQDDMSDYCNADTVYIYRMEKPDGFRQDLPQPYQNRYTTCIGVNLSKEGHPCGIMKLLLSDKAAPRAEEYLQAFLGSVRYADQKPELSREKVERVRRHLKRRFGFGMKKKLNVVTELGYPFEFKKKPY